MAGSLAPTPVTPTPFLRSGRRRPPSFLGFQNHRSRHQIPFHISDDNPNAPSNERRDLLSGLVGIAFGFFTDSQIANAAQKRPPPPPPREKKDPNVSGVQAKVLASIKRKEAMKEEIAKQRTKGKTIQSSQ